MSWPASPLLWNVGFDPIVVALADALGVEGHTCVDDLMAEVWGPQAALETEVLLGAAAGLRVEAGLQAHPWVSARAHSKHT